jgi:hypothetical protein
VVKITTRPQQPTFSSRIRSLDPPPSHHRLRHDPIYWDRPAQSQQHSHPSNSIHIHPRLPSYYILPLEAEPPQGVLVLFVIGKVPAVDVALDTYRGGGAPEPVLQVVRHFASEGEVKIAGFLSDCAQAKGKGGNAHVSQTDGIIAFCLVHTCEFQELRDKVWLLYALFEVWAAEESRCAVELCDSDPDKV